MKNTALTVILVLLMMFAASCTTTGESGIGTDVSSESAPRPAWMDEYPDSAQWYTGIAGVPWSGDESTDRSGALAAARAEIAASISVAVEQEIEIIQEESRSGSSFSLNSEVREQVRQSVQASLRDVEIVDTYYNRSSGFWVYARLSRERWEEIIRMETEQLRERVLGILGPVLDNDEIPFATVMRQFARARQILQESSWAYLTAGTLGGRNGILMDLLDREISGRLDGVVIQAGRYEDTIEYGDGAFIPVSVDVFSTSRTGSVRLNVMEDGLSLMSVLTDQEGRGEIGLEPADLSPGSHAFEVAIDLSAFGFTPEQSGSYPEVSFPFSIMVVSPEIYLSMRVPEDLEGTGLETAVESIFSEKELPFAFHRDVERGGRLQLEVDLQLSDYPKYLENAPEMASALMRFTLIRDGQRLFSYESSASKEGGLTVRQAHERAAAALLRELRSDEKLFTGLEKALSAR
jgi:predicted small secreted protein